MLKSARFLILNDVKEVAMLGVLSEFIRHQDVGDDCSFLARSFARRCIACAPAQDKRVPADYAHCATRTAVSGAGEGLL